MISTHLGLPIERPVICGSVAETVTFPSRNGNWKGTGMELEWNRNWNGTATFSGDGNWNVMEWNGMKCCGSVAVTVTCPSRKRPQAAALGAAF